MTKFTEQFPLPHVSVTLTGVNVVVAEFYGREAERRARDLAGHLAGLLHGEVDVSVSDEFCPSCFETFWNEAPHGAPGGEGWLCPACGERLPDAPGVPSRPLKGFSSELQLDADHGEHGWEIVLRYDAESMEGAYTDLSDEQLPGIVGGEIAATLIAERDRQHKEDQ